MKFKKYHFLGNGKILKIHTKKR